MRERLVTGAIAACAMALAGIVLAAQQPPAQPVQPPLPSAPNPATPGERTQPPPETPPRPSTPPQAASQQGGGAPSAVPNAYASTYTPLPSRTTVIRNATILTAAGPAIERGSIL